MRIEETVYIIQGQGIEGNMLNKDGKMFLDEVRRILIEFLAEHEGQVNDEVTYVRGVVRSYEGGLLDWGTPARDSLAVALVHYHGRVLYDELQQVLKRHDIQSVAIEVSGLGPEFKVSVGVRFDVESRKPEVCLYVG